MKKNIMKILVIIIFSLLLTYINAYSETDLNSTNPTSYSIEFENKKHILRKIPELYVFVVEYVPGIYRMPYSSLSGIDLNVYPNGEYTITSWCDLCFERTLEIGQWKYITGKIILKRTDALDSEQVSWGLKRFEQMIGQYAELNFYVISKDNFIGDSILCSNEYLIQLSINEDNKLSFLSRIRYYANWPMFLKDQKSKSKYWDEEKK